MWTVTLRARTQCKSGQKLLTTRRFDGTHSILASADSVLTGKRKCVILAPLYRSSTMSPSADFMLLPWSNDRRSIVAESAASFEEGPRPFCGERMVRSTGRALLVDCEGECEGKAEAAAAALASSLSRKPRQRSYCHKYSYP